MAVAPAAVCVGTGPAVAASEHFSPPGEKCGQNFLTSPARRNLFIDARPEAPIHCNREH